MLLVNSYGDEMVKIEDSCAHCHERIFVTLEKGRMTAMAPERVWVQRGGG
ncbi:MAG: hypothetical protein ACE5I1_06800 [bacterium]